MDPPWLAAPVAAGILGGAWGLGKLLTRAFPPKPLRHANLTATGLGLGTLSHLWFLFGILGWYRPAVAWTVWGVGMAFFLAALFRAIRGGRLRQVVSRAREFRNWPHYDRLLVLILSGVGAAGLVGAFVSPFSIDVLRYHLTAPKLFIGEGRFTFLPIFLYTQPLGGEMFYLWGLLLSGPLAGKITITLHGILAAWAVFCLAQRHGDWAGGLHAALLFACATPIWYFAFEGKTDLVLFMHVSLALLSFDIWMTERAPTSLILSGLFMGFAASSKRLGLYAAGALAIVLFVSVVRASELSRRRCAPIALYLSAAALTGAPWYLTTWLQTGDPLWPFLFPWIGGREGSGTLYQEVQFARLRHGPSGFLSGLLGTLLGMPLIWGRSLIGPLLFAGLPLLALSVQAASRVAWLLGWAIAYYAFWFSFTQYGRYLLPAFPGFAVPAAIGLVLAQQVGPLARRTVRAAIVLWGATSVGLAAFQAIALGPVVIGLEPTARFLARFTSYDTEIRWMNAHLPQDAVVASDHGALYYLDRRSIWLAGTQAFIDWGATDSIDALQRALARWGVTHVFLTTTAEDSRLSNDRSAVLTHELASRCGTILYQNPQAVFVTSVLLEQREASAASIISLARCDRPDN